MNPAVLVERRKNALRILNHLIRDGETSRLQLARILDLSAGTVTNIVSELLEKQLVLESRQEYSSIGRKSTLLKFNASLHHIITASIGIGESIGRQIRMAACNICGEVLFERDYPCDVYITEENSEILIIKRIIGIFRDFVGSLPEDIQGRLCAVGICVGGMVNNNQTIDMPRENWNSVNLAVPLCAALHLPVHIEGITRIKGLYEMRYVDPSEKNVIFLHCSTGVGMANFFDGKMVRGKKGLAGEVGHISLDINGPRCYCGNCGCFEQFCGMDNILKRIPSLLDDTDDVLYELVVNQKQPITPALLFLAHRQGSLVVHNLLCKVAEYLGAGIASIINIYDPDRIIISGYVRGEDDFLIDRAIARARIRIFNNFDRNIVISRARLESDNLHLPTSAFVLKAVLENLL